MFFDRILYQNSIINWLVAVAIAVAVFLVMRLAKAVIKQRVGQLAVKTAVDWDDLIEALTIYRVKMKKRPGQELGAGRDVFF